MTGQQIGFDSINFETIQFRHLTSADGLTHNRVHSAVQDDQGYMWFGTQDGLSRWDGFSIKTFYPKLGDTLSISGSLVTDLEKDNVGNLWIVSHQGDLCKYNTGEEVFKTYHYPEFESGIVLTSEMEIFIDSEDIIWIGTFDDGFVRFDPKTEEFKRYDVIKSLVSDDDRVQKNSVLVIAEDADNPKILWLGTNNGLFSFHKDSEVITSHTARDNSAAIGAIRGIQKDDNGNIWLATLGSGIVRYHILNNLWNHYVPNQEMWNQNNFSANFIQDLKYKSPTEFWISCAEFGSGIFNTKTELFTFFKHSSDNPTSIASQAGYKVYVDPGGTVWWMHDNRGISYMEAECQIFEFKDFDIESSQSSWNRFLADFSIDPATGNLYAVGHVSDGFFKIDHRGQEIQRIPMAGFEGIINRFDAVLCTSFGEILVGGFENKSASYDEYVFSPFLHLDKKTQQLKPYRIDRFASLQNKNINDIYEDSNGNIWIATDTGFLYCYNHATDELKEFLLKTKHGTGINFIIENKKLQKLFLATFNGIFTFDLNLLTFDVINDTEEFSSKGIALSKDESTLWIGTRQLGVQSYLIQEDRLLPIAEYRNAPRTPVEKIFIDKNDGVWATTERGLFLLDKELELFYDFNTKNGISNDYFYSQGVAILADGTILLGQQNGYYYFQAEELMQTLVSGPPLITNILVNQEDHRKRRNNNGEFYLDLPYNKNSVSVSFSSVSYCQQDKVLFQYKLDGLENEWLIPFENERTIHYPSLISGNYRFMVKKVGDPDENVASIKIKITPPFWRSWLAYLLYLILILYCINWVFSMKLKRQREKEELRVKLSSDIHDDVGTLLAGLSAKSEILALNKKGEEKEILQEISGDGREAIDRLRDIVWVLDSRKDKYENLVDKMTYFIDSAFRHTDIECLFQAENLNLKQSLGPDVRQNMYMIFKESITNLIKHSNGDKAEVKLWKNDSFLFLSVYDNGTNTQILKSEGQGLSNMKMRAEKVGGRLSINNESGFLLQFEIKV